MRVSQYQIDSNSPGEDKICVHHIHEERMSVFAVIDGHGGGTVLLLLFLLFIARLTIYELAFASDLCAKYLIGLIESKAELISQHAVADNPQAVADILTDVFISLDEIILNECKRMAEEELSSLSSSLKEEKEDLPSKPPASFRAGCCALLLLIVSSTAYVAHVG